MATTRTTRTHIDVTTVETPGEGNMKFKMIRGIDQTLPADRPFQLGREGLIASSCATTSPGRNMIDQVRGLPGDRSSPVINNRPC